jgi:HAD superfamily hydrolase (TIGR01490 family)
MKPDTRAAALFDLDGTLYNGYIWQALTRHHTSQRCNLPILYAYLGLHLPLWPLMKAGLISADTFYHAWGANMAWLVRGIEVSKAQAIWDWLIEHQILPQLRPEMVTALEAHRAARHRVLLLSGTFLPLLERLADQLELEAAIATPLARRSLRYTGRIVPPLSIGEGKLRRLERYLSGAGQGIELERSYFYTDSIVDAPLLERVGYPVAVYPDQELVDLAGRRGWQVVGPPGA